MEELSNILWSYSTIPREDKNITPFHLVYRREAVVSVKIGITYARVSNYDKDNAKHSMKRDLIEESQNKIATQLKAYKQ